LSFLWRKSEPLFATRRRRGPEADSPDNLRLGADRDGKDGARRDSLQDLGFIVDKVDDALGTVSGTKLSGYAMRMTVTIRPRGEKQIAIRASAEYNLSAVSDPKPYQQFFAALEKAMFLTANQVD
jgi:hypothetical protein